MQESAAKRKDQDLPEEEADLGQTGKGEMISKLGRPNGEVGREISGTEDGPGLVMPVVKGDTRNTSQGVSLPQLRKASPNTQKKKQRLKK